MIDEILINVGIDDIRVALLGGGRVREVVYSDPRRPSLIGNIYLGRVKRVVPGVQAAFVDIGTERAAFLGAREASHLREAPDTGHIGPVPDIRDLVQEGQEVLVQVTKDPVGEKGPRATASIGFAGRYLIYRPADPRILLSQRITEATVRERLTGMIEQLRLAGAMDRNAGCILRTAAADADGQVLAAEVKQHEDSWQEILEQRGRAKAPAILYRDDGPVRRALRDHFAKTVRRVLVDDAEAMVEARSMVVTLDGGRAETVALFVPTRETPSIFHLCGVEQELDALLDTRVDLPGGGSIVIETTEALTAIDVNAGAAVEGRSREETAFRTNLEAVREAAAQLRLRAIGGAVVIDILRLEEAGHVDSVLVEIEKATAPDHVPVRVLGVTGMGMLELTRKRTGEPVAWMRSEPLAENAGMGRVRTVADVGREILRRAQVEAVMAPPGNIAITASPDIVAWLRRGERAQELRRRTGRTIGVSAETEFSRTSYEISISRDDLN